MGKKQIVLANDAKTKNKPLKSFWRQEGHDYMAHLGAFKRAIVVTYFTPKFPSYEQSYYSIGERSYFPFTKEQHDKKFNNHFDCIEYSESIVLEFVQSLFVNKKASTNLVIHTHKNWINK